MGISISYSGSLDDPARLNDLIAFAKKRASKYGWRAGDVCEEISGLLLVGRCDVPNDSSAENASAENADPPPVLLEEQLRGVTLYPPCTEPVNLVFNRAGQLSNYCEIPAQMLTSPPAAGETYFMDFGHWTKVTGEVSVHIKLVTLLRELKDRYISNLEVHDETGYFETGDLVNLIEEHMLMGAFLNSLRDPAMLRLVMQEVGLGAYADGDLIPLPNAIPERPRESRKPNRRARAAVN